MKSLKRVQYLGIRRKVKWLYENTDCSVSQIARNVKVSETKAHHMVEENNEPKWMVPVLKTFIEKRFNTMEKDEFNFYMDVTFYPYMKAETSMRLYFEYYPNKMDVAKFCTQELGFKLDEFHTGNIEIIRKDEEKSA